MEKDWKSTYSGGYFSSTEAFLFSIDKNQKYEAKQGSANQGYWDTHTYGPCFGGDLYVDGNLNGYCYASAYSGFNSSDLAGNQSFSTAEYEIYHLQ